MDNSTGSHLLQMCMVACIHMQPFINRIYHLGESLFQTKNDASPVTLADTIVQSLVRKLLLPFVDHYIGEEPDEYDFDHPTVTDQELNKEIMKAYDEICALTTQCKYTEEFRTCKFVAIIDPIDGTREFTTKKGQESTICIGFARKEDTTEKYVPYAGLIFRPIYREVNVQEQPEYAMGCFSEGFRCDTLSRNAYGPMKILTSNGILSSFVQEVCSSGYVQVCSGGCGNKTLLLLEGKGDIYIQDRGVSRWDTCAAQAILEAYEGGLWKLTDLLESNAYKKYDYRVTDVNMDPNPIARFGKMNMKAIVQEKLDTKIGEEITLVKPYSNLCGLVALPYRIKSDTYRMNALYEILQSVFQKNLPIYN